MASFTSYYALICERRYQLNNATSVISQVPCMAYFIYVRVCDESTCNLVVVLINLCNNK
jgi:hypothetical protein